MNYRPVIMHQTGSSSFASTISFSGGLLAATDPNLADAALVFLPYCSNDAWAGSVEISHYTLEAVPAGIAYNFF